MELHSMSLLFSKSSVSNVGRTLIFNLLYLLSMAGTVLGALFMIVGMTDIRQLVFMFYPMVGFGQLFFLCATLSVSTVWNSMAKKAAPILVSISSPSAATSTHTNTEIAANNEKWTPPPLRWIRRYLTKMPKLSLGVDAPIPTSLIALTVTMMISYFSPLYISSAMSVCCLVIAISFAAAGSRMARLLTLSTEPVAKKQHQRWELRCCKRSDGGNSSNGNDGGNSHSCSEDSSESVDIHNNSTSEFKQHESEDSKTPGESQSSSQRSHDFPAGAVASSLIPARVPHSPLTSQPLPLVSPALSPAHASPRPPSLPTRVADDALQKPQASVGVLQVAAQIRGTAHFIVG
jgi:hypothetical protein